MTRILACLLGARTMDRLPALARPIRHLLLVVLAALALMGPPGGRAADPQPYAVNIKPTGVAALDAAVKGSSTLVSLRQVAPVAPFALVGRARDDISRFLAALHSFGYYNGSVAITIAGRPLDDAGLISTLDKTPAAKEVPVDVTLTLGPLFHLRHIDLQGEVPDGFASRLDLKSGASAVASDVLAAGNRLQQALQDNGYAFAKVDPPIATLIAADQALDVSYKVDAGPRLNLGPIAITGMKRVNESFIRRRLLLHPGELYDPVKIEQARQDLASQGVFSSVRITHADQPDEAEALPMTVTVNERPRHAVSFTAAYSTDLGGSIGASWTDRNVFGNAEQLTLSAAIAELGGSAARQPGYNAGATYTIPDWLQRDQSLAFSLQAVKEYLLAYERTALIAGMTVNRRLTQIDPDLNISLGLNGEEAQFVQEGMTRNYTLLQVPLTARYDTTHDPFNPTHGVRVAVTLTPSQSFSTPNSTFLIDQVAASTYITLVEPGWSLLALRALVGGVTGGGPILSIPPDQRFYAGGGGTVRGYRYQSIGPRFPNNEPEGGTSIEVGSVEFRQRFGTNYGAVAFVDAGRVGGTGIPGSTNSGPGVGVGVGARYYTSIGPIRVDVAVPLIHITKSDKLDLYIGIGQAF
jgi:translocation and assembly module TamA